MRAGKVLNQSGIASLMWEWHLINGPLRLKQNRTVCQVRTAGQCGESDNPGMILNACGSSWNQPVNFWLDDGTPVINSIASGQGDTVTVTICIIIGIF